MNENDSANDRRPVADVDTPGVGVKAFCTRVRRFREFYKEGTLGETAIISVEVHLKHCEECSRYYED